jgi:hypothetical protein
LALQILDEILPVKSGKDYRIQTLSDKDLYAEYKKELKVKDVRFSS